jgi:hypothetical protein
VFKSTLRPHYPQKATSTQCTGGWLGPRAVWMVRKVSPAPGFDPFNAQPVGRCHTDYTIPTQRWAPVPTEWVAWWAPTTFWMLLRQEHLPLPAVNDPCCVGHLPRGRVTSVSVSGDCFRKERSERLKSS